MAPVASRRAAVQRPCHGRIGDVGIRRLLGGIADGSSTAPSTRHRIAGTSPPLGIQDTIRAIQHRRRREPAVEYPSGRSCRRLIRAGSFPPPWPVRRECRQRLGPRDFSAPAALADPISALLGSAAEVCWWMCWFLFARFQNVRLVSRKPGQTRKRPKKRKKTNKKALGSESKGQEIGCGGGI